MTTRRSWTIRELGLWGTAFGAGLLPLSCAADVDLGTRAEAGAGSTVGPESGTGGGSSSGRGGSQNGSGGTPNGDDSGGRPGVGGAQTTGGAPGSGGTGVSSGSGGMPSDECTTSLTASTAHNYSYSSQLDLELTRLKPGNELTFDWGNLTHDLRGNPVDLASIDHISLNLWNMSADEFSARWEPAQFSISEIEFTAGMDADAVTHGTLSDLRYGAILDPDLYPPENHVYTLTATNGSMLGVGVYGLAAFVLDPSSDTTQVSIDSDSAHLDYNVDLHSLAPHRVPLGVADLTLDWSTPLLDGRGQGFSPSKVSRVNIASVAQTAGELEGRFLERTALSERSWSADLDENQRSFKLSEALDADGAAFPGIDRAHTWLVSLSCADCNDPVPLYLSVLEPCGDCGDGVVQLGEECDDGINAGGYGECANDCRPGPHCGDGIVHAAYEECDNGSENGHDGLCSPGCRLEPELR